MYQELFDVKATAVLIVHVIQCLR